MKKFKFGNFHIKDSSLNKSLQWLKHKCAWCPFSYYRPHNSSSHMMRIIFWTVIFLTGPEGWVWVRGDSSASVRAMIVCRGGGLGNWLHFCIDTCQQLWCNQVLFTWKQKFPGCHPFVPPSHVAPPRFERTTCGSGGMVSCTLKSQHNSCDLWLGKMIGMEINEISMELFAISVQYNMIWKSMWYWKLLYL